MNISTITPNDIDFKPLFNFYCQFFPQIERNTYESLCGYYSLTDEIYEYETIICKDLDRIIAGCYINIFKDINICFIEFIFVDQSYREQGIANKILNYLREHHSNPIFMIEVEKDGNAQRFWRHIGFKDLDYNYVQPPIVDGNKPFDGLKLMASGNVQNIDDVLINHYWKYSFA